ncbi:MAG TPA: hypothetical protein VF516_14915 [Kofleriaceae bacterium]
MSNPRYGIRATALALATASAGCGGSGTSQPPLPLSESNATSVAAEALIFTELPADSQIGGIMPGVAAGLRSLDPGPVQWLTALATGPQNVDGTVTNPCDVSGTVTVTTAGTTTTITFTNCMDNTSSTLNGTLRSTRQTSSTSNQISTTVSFNLTGTQGSQTFAESGGYTELRTLGQTSSDPTESELTGDSFSMSFSVDGKLRDQVTMSSFDIDTLEQLTPTEQHVEHFTYEVDSSRLRGHIGVMTTQDLKTGLNVFPFTGQILISGANHTRLQITVLGDEIFMPPAGQGQLELQIDPGTGTFGAPIWANWLTLSALATIER